MTAGQVLSVLAKAEISLTFSGGDLIARPTALVTEDVQAFIKEYKSDLIAHLYDDGLGLIAKWSHAFGYVSMHDPLTGEWHDLPVKDAPGWALPEARKRKELYKSGNHRAYRLTSIQMQEIREAEHEEPEEGIIEEHPLEESA